MTDITDPDDVEVLTDRAAIEAAIADGTYDPPTKETDGSGKDRMKPAKRLTDDLAASDADVADITTERTPDGVRVTFNLLNEDDLGLVRGLADEHGFERHTDGISLFDLYKEPDDA